MEYMNYNMVSPISYIRMGMNVKVAFIDTEVDEHDSYSWYDASVTKVVKRGKRFVLCALKFQDGETSRVRFYDDDYHPEGHPSEDKWKFGMTPMNTLVQELRTERNKTRDMKLLLDSYREFADEALIDNALLNVKDKITCHAVFYNEDDDEGESNCTSDDCEKDPDYEYESESSVDNDDQEEMNDPFETSDDEEEVCSNCVCVRNHSRIKSALSVFLFACFITKLLNVLSPQTDLVKICIQKLIRV